MENFAKYKFYQSLFSRKIILNNIIVCPFVSGGVNDVGISNHRLSHEKRYDYSKQTVILCITELLYKSNIIRVGGEQYSLRLVDVVRVNRGEVDVDGDEVGVDGDEVDFDGDEVDVDGIDVDVVIALVVVTTVLGDAEVLVADDKQ